MKNTAPANLRCPSTAFGVPARLWQSLGRTPVHTSRTLALEHGQLHFAEAAALRPGDPSAVPRQVRARVQRKLRGGGDYVVQRRGPACGHATAEQAEGRGSVCLPAHPRGLVPLQAGGLFRL